MQRNRTESKPDPERGYSAVIASPVGPLGITTREGELTGIGFLPDDHPISVPDDRLVASIADQLQHYFDDPDFHFELPMVEPGTPFQRRVWAALRAIPRGQTRGYGELAAQLGTAARAVGGACRANPIVVVTPCHRVIAGDGTLGGFAGATCGRPLARKRWLLGHEALPR